MIARQKIAIEYARNTLQSISDVFTTISTHISDADVRLGLLWGDFGKNIYPMVERGLYRLGELMDEVLGLRDKIKEMIGGMFLGSASEIVTTVTTQDLRIT